MAPSKGAPVVKETRKNVLGPGPGRPKGLPNKRTALLKDAILEAADRAGDKDGMVGYLQTQAIENPTAFLTLLGKVLPMTVAGDPDNPQRLEIVWKGE
jgi:hypothetical protein